jgi:replicative DNA helicase
MKSSDDLVERRLSYTSEQALLGFILLDQECLAEVIRKGIEEKHFLPAHRRIFSEMRALDLLGEPIDLVTLCERFTARQLKGIGGVSYLASLTEGHPRRLKEWVGWHAIIVRGDFLARHPGRSSDWAGL